MNPSDNEFEKDIPEESSNNFSQDQVTKSSNTFAKTKIKAGTLAWGGENLTSGPPPGDMISGPAPGTNESGGIGHKFETTEVNH